MNDVNAKETLWKSLSNLHARRGEVNTADLEAEVINNACLNILKRQRSRGMQNNNKDTYFNGSFEITPESFEVAKQFTDAAIELFPQNYTEREATLASLAIPQNVAWEGMWDFLRDYFQKNHGIEIDEVNTTPSMFYSTKHKRYENGHLTSESEVVRIVNLTFIDDKKEVLVSIEPSLSPKKGYLTSKSDELLIYKGYDPDYQFCVYMDDFQEVEKFALEMPNRMLKILYFE